MKSINLLLAAFFAVILISGVVYAEEIWNGWTVADGLGHDRVTGMTMDNNHNAWCIFESTGGISIWDGTFWDTYTTDDGLPTNYMTSIITNADGKIMIGTYGYGLIIIDSKDSVDSFTSYTTNEGLSGNVVYSIIQASDGTYWFGTHFGGLCYWDGVDTWVTYNQENTPSMPASEIKSLCEGADGKIWVTTQNQSGGTLEIGCFDPNVISPETTWQWWGAEEGIDENPHAAIAEDSSGNIWVATYGGGAYMYDGKDWTQITTSNGLKTDYTSFLTAAPDGAMWLSGWGGVTRYDGTTFMTWGPQTNDPIDPTAGLMYVWVSRIAFDSTNNIYFGNYTGGGVSLLTTEFGDPAAVEIGGLPAAITINGNFPNPFNPVTTIRFTVPEARYTRLTVYNTVGQKVRSLLSNTLSAGVHEVSWDGRNDMGVHLSSGVYHAVLTTGDIIMAHHMTLIK